MLGKFSGEHEADSRLNLATGESGLLVVGSKLSSLSGNALKDIFDEGVHDRHSLLGDTSIRVDLLEDLVDVGRVRLSTLLGLALGASGFLGWCLFGRLLGGGLGHGCCCCCCCYRYCYCCGCITTSDQVLLVALSMSNEAIE